MADLSRAVNDSFAEVVRRREAQVLRVAYRMLGNWADAEDVAQDAFLRLHRRGLDFAHDGACAAWLYRVTVNLCVDRARARKPAAQLPEIASGAASAETEAIREQQMRRLMSALAQLPPKERAAVILREIEGLSSEEAAAILGSTSGTIRSQVPNALRRLREIFGKGEV